jgi:hypothetical protein
MVVAERGYLSLKTSPFDFVQFWWRRLVIFFFFFSLSRGIAMQWPGPGGAAIGARVKSYDEDSIRVHTGTNPETRAVGSGRKNPKFDTQLHGIFRVQGPGSDADGAGMRAEMRCQPPVPNSSCVSMGIALLEVSRHERFQRATAGSGSVESVNYPSRR